MKHRFKFAFGATLATTSFILFSQGHAFASTQNVDQYYNHDMNGNPITPQHTIDSTFNHYQDGSPIISNDNHTIDPSFNHDANNNPIHSNHSVDKTSNDITPQHTIKKTSEDNDIGFNGYVEKRGLVNDTPPSTTKDHRDIHMKVNSESVHFYPESDDVSTHASMNGIDDSVKATLSQTNHSQTMHRMSSSSTLPNTGDSKSNTSKFNYFGIFTLVLAIGLLIFRRLMFKKL
ncbi:LPXTG cell wall anchor domain-containing protein [Staphylococcus hominis]|uniref:LPXTG cell wall anchor domain-containing protein n=1 Tax=Staphylococcus hominis TaxID=1290 RepID=UPI00324D51DF